MTNADLGLNELSNLCKQPHPVQKISKSMQAWFKHLVGIGKMSMVKMWFIKIPDGKRSRGKPTRR
jgi:hypothetical protein